MATISISRFMRLHDNRTNTDYRVLHITNEEIIIININTFSQLDIQIITALILLQKIRSGEVTIVDEPETNTIVNVDTLSKAQRIKYEYGKLIVDTINREYAPDYLGLLGKRSKPVIQNIINASKMTRAGIWRIIIRYLQSGCKDFSLLKRKPTCDLKNRTTVNKRGRVSENPERNGKNLTDKDREIMDEYMKKYLVNKLITKRKCYDDMISEKYMVKIFDGSCKLQELPQSQRPTFDQFIYYMNRNTTKEERMEKRLGRREYRNQKRLLTGTSLNGVSAPCDIVEMDACELDISVVSATDRSKAVGSPVVYFMVDVFSRLILAASISFDNNSILAMTNCLASLVEDKDALLQSLGITIAPLNSGITLTDAMPTCVLPKIIRFDHGSDFISKQAQRIGQQLKVELQYAPPATGSLKGVVERSFRSFQSEFIDLTFGAGTKNHDALSKPNREAKLTIEDVKLLMYSFILQHNTTQHDSSYHLTPDMVKHKVGHVPAEIWRYGIQHAGNPTYITDKEQFLFSLLTPESAKIRRDGINYKKLRFIPDLDHDNNIRNLMLSAKNGSLPITIYIDLRTVRQVYYMGKDNKLYVAKLVNDINHKEFSMMTWPEFDAFCKEERRLLAEKDVEAEKTRRAHRRITKEIVKDAKSHKGKTDNKNMKETRAAERSRVAGELAFDKRFGFGQAEMPELTEPVKPEHVEEHVDLQSMTEAELEEFRRKQIAELMNFEEEDF